MKNQKIALMVGGALIIGIVIGVWGASPSTKSNFDQKDVQQSTVQDGSSNASPSAQSIQKPAGKVEVKSQTKRISVLGDTEVVGEVINKTQNEVRQVEITATFYDAEGKVIATDHTYVHSVTDTNPLLVGSTAPFDVSSSPDKINADSFKLDVTWR